jgi:hypothetical protein
MLPKLVPVAALPLLISACWLEEDCRPATLGEVDQARSCVLPAGEVEGLQICHRSGALRTKGLVGICIADINNGKEYAGYIGTDEHGFGFGFVFKDDCPVDHVQCP